MNCRFVLSPPGLCSLSAVALLAAAGSAAADDGRTYSLRYKFQAGQSLYYEVENATTIVTRFNGSDETVTNQSRAWKQLRVTSVDGQGGAQLEPVVERVVMSATKDGEDAVTYDSAVDADPPLQFLDVKRTIGQVQARVSVGGFTNLTQDHLDLHGSMAEYFEATVTAFENQARAKNLAAEGWPRAVANWITGELFRLMNATGTGIEAVKPSPAALAELVGLVAAGQINLNSAKKAFEVMFETGRPAAAIVQELGLAQVSDEDALTAAVAQTLAKFPAEVARYRAGEQKLFGWLIGQVMRETQGKGNPAMVRRLLETALKTTNGG